ncbi:MAG: preprotein translocase subunit YajC [Gammaproteobacteria bacterium]|nr:preprotein translocase subunit YajC [Gammaproteobacteria bacterium]
MSLFISDAWAEGAATPPADGGILGFLPLIAIFVAFYFMLIRPQVKRAKEHRKMLEALAKGDEVATSGGLMGKITDMGDSYIAIEVAEGVVIKVQKHAVASLLPKGTLKSTNA